MNLKIFFSFMLLSLPFPSFSQFFEDVTELSGINHSHIAPNLMGGGVGIIDYNNDGFEDIYFTGGVYEDELFKNNGDGSFTKAGVSAGIFDATRIVQTTGVTIGDFDNDGWEDILVCTEPGENNILFRNTSDGRFENISIPAGLLDKSWSMGASFADFNLDGLLDIYIINYINESKTILNDNGEVVGFDHDCFPNSLYINNGDNTFTEKASLYGVDSKGCALAVTITDINGDAKPDIYIANDFGEWVLPNQLFQNEFPSNTFLENGAALSLNVELYGMGISSGDINHDGLLDYYITNLGKNALLKQTPGGIFEDIADYANVGNEKVGAYNSTSWGTQIFDINHDGSEDLYVANGYIGAASFLQTTLEDPNKLFISDGLGKFVDESISTEMDDIAISRGSAIFDYDNDGDMDLVVVNISSVSSSPSNIRLYENVIGNQKNWLKIKLKGKESNLQGYGAMTYCYSEGEVFVEEIFGGGSYASKSSSIAHFGFDAISMLDSVIVVWPGGKKQKIFNLLTNQFIQISEDDVSYGVIGCMDINNVNFNQSATINSGCFINNTTTSLSQDLISNKVYFYPNPVISNFKIVGEIDFPIKVEVLNSYGRLEKSIPFYGKQNTVDISDLANGVYFLRLNSTIVKYLIKVD
ncbi:MAG: FG-GAP-like repeat-containing protein [Cyclobacteriaceae bacterium]|nr:FG-GAP-like repeat-containing protein [Cyclobacteriaceae bacterium]